MVDLKMSPNNKDKPDDNDVDEVLEMYSALQDLPSQRAPKQEGNGQRQPKLRHRFSLANLRRRTKVHLRGGGGDSASGDSTNTASTNVPGNDTADKPDLRACFAAQENVIPATPPTPSLIPLSPIALSTPANCAASTTSARARSVRRRSGTSFLAHPVKRVRASERPWKLICALSGGRLELAKARRRISRSLMDLTVEEHEEKRVEWEEAELVGNCGELGRGEVHRMSTADPDADIDAGDGCDGEDGQSKKSGSGRL
jgi:hypothetical protein